MKLSAQIKSWIPWISIVVMAVILTVPCALTPVRLTGSFWIDWVWLDQFARVLREGIVYPRWLPLSHGGLGSPVFYYYPPLAFYLGSIFVNAGLPVYASILATFFAGFLISGIAMYLWLRGQARFPLVGALIFMAAPYHVYNFYHRGAVAEFVATAVLPFVALGLRLTLERYRGGWALAALGYGALIASHMPLALVATVFFFGPYTIAMARLNAVPLVRVASALATGALLAAIYLVPALTLGQYRDVATMWASSFYKPSSWTVWDPQLLSSYFFLWSLLIAWSLIAPLAMMAARERSGWAKFGFVLVLVTIGVFPPIWSLPLLSQVQFPTRLFPVAEFAFATAVATAPMTARRMSVLSLAPLLVTIFIISAPPAVEWATVTEIEARHPDVPENLPPGARPLSSPSRWALEIAASHRRPQFANGTTVEPVFFFPAWQVTCGGHQVDTFPDPQTQLLSYKGRDCTRTLGWTNAERVGAALSLVAALMLALSLLRSRRR